MLIRSNQLTLNEASSILDNGVYLTEAESALNPVAVPVLENQRLGICTVSYNDIQRVCEDYGCYSYDALYAIAESSNIDIDNIAVAIDEADIILNPNIVDRFPLYVINPISENSFEYIFTESCIELFLENDYDVDYLDALDGSIFDEASNFTYNAKGEVISDSDKTGKSKGSKGFSTFNNTNGSQGARMLKNGRSVGDISSSGLTPMQQIMKLKGELKKKGRVTAKRRKEINDKIDEIKKQMGANLSSNVATHKAAIAASTGRATTKKYNERVNKNLTKDSLEELKKASEAESRRLRGEEEPMSREDALKEIEKEKASANNDVKEQEDKIKETVQKAQQSNDPGFISKVVASLRNFYRKFLEKANQEHDSGKIAWYRNFARVILNYIDKLLAKLDKTQNS